MLLKQLLSIPAHFCIKLTWTYLSVCQSNVINGVTKKTADTQSNSDTFSTFYHAVLQKFSSSKAHVQYNFLANYYNNNKQPLSTLHYSTGCVPTDWRLANITPLFKKGANSDPSNYWPVSLTSVVCKLMESIIRDVLVTALKDKFSCSQHGFMKHRSCLTNILESLEAWTKALDEGYGIDVIYLDYRKAFDTVSHPHLIEKLKVYGISGKLLQWIKNFLYSRKMRVRVRNSFSEWVSVLSGVPQGSVLGALLFLSVSYTHLTLPTIYSV